MGSESKREREREREMVCKPWEQINNLTSPLLTSTTFSFSSVFIFSPALHPSFFSFSLSLSLSLSMFLSLCLSCLSFSLGPKHSRNAAFSFPCFRANAYQVGCCWRGWQSRLSNSQLHWQCYMQAKEKEKSKLVRRLIAEKCLSVQLFL